MARATRSDMSWLQLHLDIDRDAEQHYEQVLLDLGAVSITLSDGGGEAVLEPGVGATPLWRQVKLHALFPAEIDTDAVLLGLRADTGASLPPWRWETLEDKVWEIQWQADFKPMRCGSKLWICPSWCEPPQPDAVNLRLDPGLAFGTGTHATTFLCLQWLDSLDLAGRGLMDYGCGSGILAIAGLLLGASHATAVDNDPQALSATEDNARRNDIETGRLAIHTPTTMPADPQDYLLANILAGTLIELARPLTELVKSGGAICLSGILASQYTAVAKAYQAAFILEPPVELDGWLRLVGHKP